VTPFGEKRRYAVFWPFVVATDSAVETYESAKIGDRRFDFCINNTYSFSQKNIGTMMNKTAAISALFRR